MKLQLLSCGLSDKSFDIEKFKISYILLGNGQCHLKYWNLKLNELNNTPRTKLDIAKQN